MFGHLDLGFADDESFRPYLCSLCGSLGENFGLMARFLTNYDMALCWFVAREVSSSQDAPRRKVCPLLVRNGVFRGESRMGLFLSSITILLTAEKVKDDSLDGGKHYPRLVMKWLEKKITTARRLLRESGFDPLVIEEAFDTQRRVEEQNSATLADLAESTARVMSAIYGHAAAIALKPPLKQVSANMGYLIGQIIYVIDNIIDYNADIETGSFNPLKGCLHQNRIIKQHTLPDDALRMAKAVMYPALEAIEEALAKLNMAPVVMETLTRALRQKVEDCLVPVERDMEGYEQGWIQKLRRYESIPLPLLSFPHIVSASNGRDGGNACCASFTFLIIMAILYVFICRGCCGRACRSGPDRVTVDHGCGGRRTYRRDRCTGRYRDDGCC